MKTLKRINNLTIAVVLLVSLNTLKTFAQMDRSTIEDKYKWDLSVIYPSDESWKKAKEAFVVRLDSVEIFRGKVMQSPQSLLTCLNFITELTKDGLKLYSYANLTSDLDKRDMKNSGMEKEMQQVLTGYFEKISYLNPEILKTNWQQVDSYMKQEPRLEVYRQSLRELFHDKDHKLNESEERILALSSLIDGVPGSVFSTFADAEMPYPEVVLSNGDKAILNSSGYEKYRESENREDRKKVFEAFWKNYEKFEGTFGEMLYGCVKSHMFYARARKYSSSLEAALDPNNIPVDVYKSLIDNVNKNLPAFQRYLTIKKRMLGVDTLKYMDMYAPVVKNIDLNFTYDEARDLVLKSMVPLGPEYVKTVEKAFNERWIDVYPNAGKRSGAYSSDIAYGVHPYILLNFNGTYDDASTVAHELGHTMHSFYAMKTQPYVNSDYSTFVAEVASTFNEVLFFDYFVKTIKDDNLKLAILMNWIDSFKGTLFRQTQFAEFELKIHELAESGQPLTGEIISKAYMDIIKKYYGHDKGICYIDDYVKMEWAFIPHFYAYNFYVYQYSTSFTASMMLSKGVINNEKGALDRYINFLSSGGSDYPIELLKKAGVDMTTSAPFDETIKTMNEVMDEIEKILDKKEKS